MFDNIKAVFDRDPAAKNILEVILCYPGLHAIWSHRVAQFFYKLHIPLLPRLISQFSRFLTGIEIHPGADVASGTFIDHGHGVVIGETALIGKNVTIFQDVTLGGTGKEKGKRHPTIEDNVTISVGAKILGNITIGKNSKVGAGSVVIKSVPPNSTVVGVPGRIVTVEGKRISGVTLDHDNLPDPIIDRLDSLQKELIDLEKNISLYNEHKKETP